MAERLAVDVVIPANHPRDDLTDLLAIREAERVSTTPPWQLQFMRRTQGSPNHLLDTLRYECWGSPKEARK